MVSRYRAIGAYDSQFKTHSSYDELSRLSPSNSHAQPAVRTMLVNGCIIFTRGPVDKISRIVQVDFACSRDSRPIAAPDAGGVLRLWSLEVWFMHVSATSGQSTYQYITNEFNFTRIFGSTRSLIIFEFICGNYARAFFQISVLRLRYVYVLLQSPASELRHQHPDETSITVSNSTK